MSTRTPEEEAYLLGCLFGRGSISLGSGRNFKLIFRVPFREYSPAGVAIVKTLQTRSVHLDDLCGLPRVKAMGFTRGDVGRLIHRLRRWHPPNLPSPNEMLKVKDNVWAINDKDLANEYLVWQDVLHKRETLSMNFILKHLSDTAQFLASKPIYRDEMSVFKIVNHVIECDIPPLIFNELRSKYGLDMGEIHLHFRIPKSVFNFNRESSEEFIRGLADTIGDFDYNPLMKPNWRVQFSILFENPKLSVEICQLLQTKLNVPVFYIDYAGGKRKHRDHLLKVWVTAFERANFKDPLFYNVRKQEDFLTHLKEARESLDGLVKLPSAIGYCPRKWRTIPDYVKSCRKSGCPRVAVKSLKLNKLLKKGK